MRPHRGPHVASASVESLEEIYLLRETLDGLAVHLAAECITDDELAEVIDIHERFVAAHEAFAATELAALSDHFHMAIYTAAKTPMLVRLIKIVIGPAPSGILASIPGRADRSLVDHTNMVAALKARDADLARQLMQRHLHDTLAFVNEFQQSGTAQMEAELSDAASKRKRQHAAANPDQQMTAPSEATPLVNIKTNPTLVQQ